MKWNTQKQKKKLLNQKLICFKKINTVDKPLPRNIRRKREKTQIISIRNERYGSTDSTDIKRIIREYAIQVFKFSNLGEMGKCLERCKLLKK